MVHIPTEDGRWVSEHFERLARVIRDYDQHLELRWIPVENRESVEERRKPYQVFDKRANAPVLFAGELDSPEDILERLFLSDSTKGDVVARLDARNDAVQALQIKARMDAYEEAEDKAKFMIGTPLHYIKMDGIKYDSERRRMT